MGSCQVDGVAVRNVQMYHLFISLEHLTNTSQILGLHLGKSEQRGSCTRSAGKTIKTCGLEHVLHTSSESSSIERVQEDRVTESLARNFTSASIVSVGGCELASLQLVSKTKLNFGRRDGPWKNSPGDALCNFGLEFFAKKHLK